MKTHLFTSKTPLLHCRAASLLPAMFLLTLAAPSLFAASGAWSLNASGGLWSDTVNWGGGTIADGSGFTATFGGGGNNIAGDTTVLLDSDRTLTNLSFTDDAPATPGNWFLTNNGDPTNNLILAGTTPTITVAIAFGGTSQAATISAIIEGTGGLTKKGTGTLILANANTFTGGIVMGVDSNAGGADASNGTNAGILAVTDPAALGTSAITINGRFQNQGKLQLSNDVAITAAGNITFTNSRQAIGALGGGGNGSVGGSASSSALGYANIENLSGNNSLNSNMTIANGGGNGVNILSLAGTLTLTGNLTHGVSGGTRVYSFAGAGDTNVTGVISNGAGTMSVTKENAGLLTLSGTNTYTGVTTIAGGILRVATIGNGGVAGNLGASSAASTNLVFSNGTLQHIGAVENINRGFTILAGTTATLQITNNLTLAGANGGATTGALTKTGPGTLGLTGTNSYTGITTISAGTLQLGDTGATGSLSPSSTIVNNGTFTIARNNAVIQGTHFSGAPITGTGGFTQFGAGTTTLNAANTYLGLTAINAGTLVVTGGAAIADTGAVFINNVAGATLQLNASETIGSLIGGGLTSGTVALGANTLTVGDDTSTLYSGAITGAAGTLFKQGTGALTLNGSQTYGTLTANDGTTNVNSFVGTGDSTVNANAIVNFGSSQTLAALNIGAGAVVTLAGSAASLPEAMVSPSLTVATVPEPGSFSLLLLGALGLIGASRRSARMV